LACNAWRKYEPVASSLKTTSTLNGKQGNINVCNEFTEEFRTVFQSTTVNSDCIFEEEFFKLTELVIDDTRCPQTDTELRQHCIQTRNSAIADKPARRIYRSVKVTKHSTIPYVRYSFLLCNCNFVFKIFHFKNVVTLKSRSEVIESGTIQ